MLKEEVRFCGGSIFEGMLSVRTLIENEISFKDGVSENDRKIRQVLYDRERAKERKMSSGGYSIGEMSSVLRFCSVTEKKLIR